MSAKLLTPNEKLVDASGSITTNWWRSLQTLTQIQIKIATPTGLTFVADWTQTDEIRVSLTASLVTITNVGASDGQRCILTLIQDLNGGHEVAFTSETDFGPAGVPRIDLASNSRTHIELIFQAPIGTYDAFILFGESSAIGSGGVTKSSVTKVGNYTATVNDFTILMDCTAGNLVVQLPPAGSVSGQIFNIVKIDATANNCTVQAYDAETISGSNTQFFNAQWFFITIQSNGLFWVII